MFKGVGEEQVIEWSGRSRGERYERGRSLVGGEVSRAQMDRAVEF